ncbi:FGGY-family carbohydrate kinase [Martelella alba]|nr:FGGY-family carbohydrate kinase [Martelella alba]
MQYWLGIDCGGTFIKAGLYDQNGKEQGIARSNLDVLCPEPGWAERDMAALWHAMAGVIRALLGTTGIHAGAIAGVGISAQGKGLFLLDKRRQPLGNGVLSSDQRSRRQVEQWRDQGMLRRIYPLTRQTLWTGHPVSILRWIKQHQPERYAGIGSILMAHDYLRFCLTGQLGCEETNISESNLYHMSERRYDAALAQWLGIPEAIAALPPVVGSSDIVGAITPQAAEYTGLLAGTPVVGGLFDVVSTALCAGLHDESRLNAVMGTWAVTSGIARDITGDESYPYVYGRHAETDRYIVHEASPTSAANMEWFARQWGLTDYSLLNDAVAALPKAAGSVLFVPFLYGSNAGRGMSAGFYGLQSYHQRAHLIQAIYEGVVFSHMTHINRMRQRFPRAGALRVTGGPARSRPWMQIMADVSGLPVELPQMEETGCLGAALAAMVGTGLFTDFAVAQHMLSPALTLITPDRDAQAAYQDKYHAYLSLIQALDGLSRPVSSDRCFSC